MMGGDRVRVLLQLEPGVRRGAGWYRPDAWMDEERTDAGVPLYRGVHVPLDEPLAAGIEREVTIQVRIPNTWRPLVRGESFGLYEGRRKTATVTVLEDWNPAALMILVAGPYRSGTDGDPARIQANVDAMTRTSLALWRSGHLPVMGEWFALPLIDAAVSVGEDKEVADAATFHPIAEQLMARCDGCLRIGGPSVGADRMVASAERLGKRVWHSIDEVPTL